MDINALSSTVSVSPQVEPSNMRAIRAGGFRMVLNNRPDGEEPGQPSSGELESAARQAGLDYRHIPVAPGQLDLDDAAAFDDAVRSAKGPVLAFSRTGARSIRLWTAAQDLSVSRNRT